MVVTGDVPFLRQFDPRGRITWQGGARGKGPGEYTAIGRVVFLETGGIRVGDAGGMRITALSPVHAVLSTTPVTFYATTFGANANGDMLLGAESARGHCSVLKFRDGAVSEGTLPVEDAPTADAVYKNASIAVAANGTVAILLNNDRYEIVRMDSTGARLPKISRAIERVRMSADEVALQHAESQRISAQIVAMKGGTGKTAQLNPAASDASLKSHANVDGLRYDAAGRLWVHTMRGTSKSTVFDVFRPSGAFLGSVTLPEVAKVFTLGGTWLLTASESDDGVPIVTKWIVR